ncbi:MAG: F0F1 ATP synthase subunit B [Eubacterium sp.]
MLKFDINILWTLINLVVFFVLMRLFLFKPIKRTLDKRKELIEKQFKDAQEANEQALELKQEYEQKVQGAADESVRIINDAKANAMTEYDKIIDRAKDDAVQIKNDARKAAQQECESVRRSAKEEIAALAMEAAEKVVAANVSADTDSAIFDEFLNESSEK